MNPEDIIEEFGLDEENFIWQDLRMCAGMGDYNIHFEDAEGNDAIKRAAIEVCNYCPVREMCLQHGIDTKSTGIFGGKTLQGGKIVD